MINTQDVEALDKTIDYLEYEFDKLDLSYRSACITQERLIQSPIIKNTWAYAFENAMDQENNAWEKITTTLRSFGEKIKSLWESIMKILHRQGYEQDYNWYINNMSKIYSGLIENKEKTVSIHDYAVKNPIKYIINDITVVGKQLTIFYDSSYNCIMQLINKSKSNTFIEELKREYGTDNLKDAMIFQVKKHWKVIADRCDIADIEEFTSESVYNAVVKKYIADNTKEVDIGSFISDMQEASHILEPNTIKNIEQICNEIINGSLKCDAAINHLDKYSKNSKFNTDENKELITDTALKRGSIFLIKSTLSICNAIGRGYWYIYLTIHKDVKNCFSACIKK